MKKAVLYSTFTAIAVFFSAVAYAGGLNRLGGVGPRAGAMSGAYIAIADGVAASYYNPAGLVQAEGTQVSVGSELMLLRFQYEAPGGISMTSDNEVSHWLPLAGFSFSSRYGVTTSLGINVPYGLGAAFEGKSALGLPATKTLITLTNLTPAIALPLSTHLSLGLGLNIGHGQLKYKVPFQVGGITMGTSDSEATGWGLGGVAGLFWKPNWFSWGLVYNTETKVELGGRSAFAIPLGSFASDFDTRFTFPARLGTGIAVRPLESLLVALDGNWYDYSGAGYLDIDYASLPDQRQILDWESNYSLHLGAEYILVGKLALRGGVGYQTAVIPDSTVSTLTPDATGWDISGGLGYRWKNLSVDISHIHALGDRSVSASPGHIAPGNYEAEVQTFAFGATYWF